MRTIPFYQTSTGLEKAPICVTVDRTASYASLNQPIGDSPVPGDASSREDIDTESYDRSPHAAHLIQNRDEDTEVDFWKRLLLAEAGWYGQERCHPEEVERALLKIQEEGLRTTIMENLRTRVGWTSEDDTFVCGTSTPTPSYRDILSTTLYSGLGLDRIESSWRDITMKLVSI